MRRGAQQGEVLPGLCLLQLIAAIAVERGHQDSLPSRRTQAGVDRVGDPGARHRAEVRDQTVTDARCPRARPPGAKMGLKGGGGGIICQG